MSDEEEQPFDEDAIRPRSRSPRLKTPPSRRSKSCNEEVKTKQKKMAQLDKKLNKKWSELRDLMKEGGMDDSVEAIEKAFETPGEKGKVKKSVTILSPNSMKVKQMGNINTNANLRRVQQIFLDKPIDMGGSRSEEMIYDHAVPIRDRNSSLSEGIIDTSDELINAEFEGLQILTDEIADSIRNDGKSGEQRREERRESERCEAGTYHKQGGRFEGDHERNRRSEVSVRHELQPWQLTPEEKVDQKIRGAEMSKARILPATGKEFQHF